MNKTELHKIFNLLAKAGSAILEVYESADFREETKADDTPVTRADRASSKIINQGLKELFPTIPILDEETCIPPYEVRKNWSKYFLLDPLDGTKEFIKRNGEFCINLALIQGNLPELGWIYQPLTETGWFCKRGEGIVEFKANGTITRLEKPRTNSDVIRIAASRSFFKPREAEIIEKMKQHFRIDIIHCGSSKKQIQMILGNADIYLKAGPCSEWDTAPGQLMVEEFGGAVLRHDTFETLKYNRENLKNPHFIMLNEQYNQPAFVAFMKNIIQN